MNLNPMSLFTRAANVVRRKSNDMSTSAIVRAGEQLGPWNAMLRTFVPQLVNPVFYEALRMAMPLIDGGINRLVLVDGLIRFGGNDQKLCDTITEAMAALPVNDVETGIQSFYELQGNEMYEQGFSLGENVMDAKGRKLVGVRVADSKGALARRNAAGNIEWWYRPPMQRVVARHDGSDQVEVVLRNNISNSPPGQLNQLNYALLDPSRLIYAAFHPEADNPYGVSLMRSMEFVSQNLLKIQNATGNVWDRYGDPPFQLTYKTKNRALKDSELNKRKAQLGSDLAAVLDAKRQGNSADFVQAIGADDDITITVIGGRGEVLELQAPTMHFVEQILAKLPLPGWMLGITEAQAGRMADQQSEIVLMESKIRFERRLPSLKSIVSTWLRGEGITWKPGDWEVQQELPNLRDIMKQAQARFLNAQADMMAHTTSDNPQTPTGVTAALGGDPNSAKYTKVLVRQKADGSVETEFYPRGRAPHTHSHGDKTAGSGDDEESESWAEDDAALPALEGAAVSGMLELWQKFRAAALDTLGVAERGAGGAAVFTFNAATMLQPLIEDEQAFIDAAGAEDGPLIRNAFAAFLRGVENAASDLDVQSTLDDARGALQGELATRDLRLVKDASVRTFHEGVLKGLQDGIYDGMNPNAVASELEDRFGLQEYDWTRLSRSEIAAAQGSGKIAQYKALGVEKVNFVTAGGACPICEDLAAQGPYALADAPQPVDDSHPNCRCTLLAVDPADDDTED